MPASRCFICCEKLAEEAEEGHYNVPAFNTCFPWNSANALLPSHSES